MSISRLALCSLALLMTIPAWAQRGNVRWQQNAEAAIADAQRSLQPIMFYVRGSTDDRDDDLERAQNEAFRDNRVAALAEVYICCKVSRSADRDLLNRIGIPQTASMMVFFTTPDGKLIDQLSPMGVAQADSLAQKMRAVFNQYRTELYQRLKPVLADASAESDRLEAALEIVERFRVEEAAEDVGKIAGRPELDAGARRTAFAALEAMATEEAVQALFQLSRHEDQGIARAAESALDDLPEPAAEFLFDFLRDENPAIQEAAYQAVGDIANVRRLKRERFWEGASATQRAAELARVEEEAKEAIAEYKEKQRRGRR